MLLTRFCQDDRVQVPQIIIAIVFGEFSFGMGWFGAVIFIIGASMGALAVYLLKDLRN
jgi:hypothetical protein